MPTLIRDTREQRPYKWPGLDTTDDTLDVGDYTYEGWANTFAVERKSLNDLATSLGAERTRFESEVRRANGLANINDDGNSIPGTKPDTALEEFAVVIEAHPDDVYEYAGTKSCPNYFSNLFPNSLIGTVEQWPNKYRTLDFVWAGDREGGRQETLALLDEWLLKYEHLL